MSTLLLVDLSNTLHRSLHVHERLSYKGEFTGGLYGTVAQIATTVNQYHCDQVLVCLDSPPYFRKKDFPAYKAKRIKKDDGFMKRLDDSKRLCSEFFATAGIETWGVPGYECDDLIAQAVESYARSGSTRRIVVKSNDSDLFQLFDFETRSTSVVIARGTKDTPTMDSKTFKKLYEVTPGQWPWCSALAGSHNGIPGLPGIGLKTALKIVRSKTLLREYRKEHPILEEYFKLCLLPYDTELPAPPVSGKFYARRAEKWLTGKGVQIGPVLGKAFEALV